MEQEEKRGAGLEKPLTERRPRGIRNNNPGNLRRSRIRWDGMSALQKDDEFVCFTAPVWGVRALMKTLLTYQRKHGLKTIEAMINRWAPPLENKTAHYVWHVARCLGVSHRAPVDLTRPDMLVRMARAIIRHENGAPPGGRDDWYGPETYTRAAGLALGFVPEGRF